MDSQGPSEHSSKVIYSPTICYRMLDCDIALLSCPLTVKMFHCIDGAVLTSGCPTDRKHLEGGCPTDRKHLEGLQVPLKEQRVGDHPHSKAWHRYKILGSLMVAKTHMKLDSHRESFAGTCTKCSAVTGISGTPAVLAHFHIPPCSSPIP
jgi:hypothetical protein